MDPITIALVTALVLAGGGAATAAVVGRRRATRKEAMRQAVRAPVPCGSHAPVSLFDVFWDLGASEFALAMMARRDLLLSDPDERAKLVVNLGEEIVAAGGMAAYVGDQLAAIEEYYRDHAAAGDRRRVLALAAPEHKMLAPAGGMPQTERRPVSYATEITGGVADREAWREGSTQGPLDGGESGPIDVDQAVTTDAMGLLRSIFGGGSIAGEAKRWWSLRAARKLRAQLDTELVSLHRIYAQYVRDDGSALTNLADSARRWEAEATRVDAVLRAQAHRKEGWAMCADVLLEEARELALRLAAAAKVNVRETLQRIDELAASGEAAMAGYLVYVNRYAFFAGRTALIEQAVLAIESALGQLGTELQSLRRKGVI